MASESGRGQTESSNTFGVRTAYVINKVYLNGVGKPIEEGENPVSEMVRHSSSIQSISGHVEPGEKTGGPPSKPKYYLMTDRGAVL